ncbi:MAG: anhydro-N-acetylmuramic acid kinase [Acetobacteraceae bacterium]|jgi:anhydro-N-acetylmuramic acid kinase|nr:anhydro-N-acetylmuramic acid kinase [Acetobacteraceae bacterium]
MTAKRGEAGHGLGLYLGMMSGTSLDGVDAALVETDGERLGRLGAVLTLPIPPQLRAALRGLMDEAETLSRDDPRLRAAEAALTALHAEAVAALSAREGITARDIAAIGFHGQTLLHRPERRLTWQIGDAAALAAATSIRVVHDFRSRDVAAGGQGAPLVPLFHAALLAGAARPVAVLNLGGVGNVTFLGAEGDVLAFDTGPANALLDDWALRHTGTPRDEGGALATRGQADEDVLAELLAHPYFRAAPPKSLDRLDFHRAVAASGLAALSAEDGAATLTGFTARAVAASLPHLPAPPRRWIVCGGGRHNPAVMAALASALAMPVTRAEDEGWDGDAIEAQAFGFLAARSLRGLPLSLPGTTGVPAPMPGGRLAEPAAA